MVPRRRMHPERTAMVVLNLRRRRPVAVRATPRCRARVDRKDLLLAWRSLFAGVGPRTHGETAGRIVRRAARARPPAGSLRAGTSRWKGPLREPHDFVAAGLDVEVKTTLSDEDEVVHIHGVEQLAR